MLGPRDQSFVAAGGSTPREKEGQPNQVDVWLVAGHRLAGEVILIGFVPRPEVRPGRPVTLVTLVRLDLLELLAPVRTDGRRGPSRRLGLEFAGVGDQP